MDVEYSFLSTVYNNSRTIKGTLESIVNAINKAEVASEIIIIDNYSTDGTFEILKTLQKELRNNRYIIRFIIIRKKCSRGLGRQLALQLALGNYVIFFDGDSLYDSDLLAIILKLYYQKFKGKVLLINEPGFYGIFPKDIAIRIGFRDLNYAEDIDFLTRLLRSYSNLTYSLPLSLSQNEDVKGDREKRYAKGVKYVYRIIRNYVDRAISYGLIPRNSIILFRQMYNLPIIETIVLSLINTIIIYLMYAKIKPIINKELNFIFVDKIFLERILDPTELGIEAYPVSSFVKEIISFSTKEIYFIPKNVLVKVINMIKNKL
jgi:glycosyltransferase involved in cell wall biosynthesis